MTLLRIIAVFILIYLVFRVVTMYIMPWLLKKFIERQRKKYYGQGSTFGGSRHGRRQKEGDTRISYKQGKQKSSDEIGEYVDFKEIKDKNTSKKKKNGKDSR